MSVAARCRTIALRNVRYYQHLLNAESVDKTTRWVRAATFSAFEHEGRVAREDARVGISEPAVAPVLTVAKEAAAALGWHGLDYECFLFRYSQGHEVPWHKDRSRHKVIVLAYFGDFDGGAYEYRDEMGAVQQILPAAGSAIVVINELPDGTRCGPYHRVRRIARGERYAISVSAVSEPETTAR